MYLFVIKCKRCRDYISILYIRNNNNDDMMMYHYMYWHYFISNIYVSYRRKLLYPFWMSVYIAQLSENARSKVFLLNRMSQKSGQRDHLLQTPAMVQYGTFAVCIGDLTWRFFYNAALANLFPLNFILCGNEKQTKHNLWWYQTMARVLMQFRDLNIRQGISLPQ